jgi:hypothetical protein
MTGGVYHLRDHIKCRDCGHIGLHSCDVAARREALEQIHRNVNRLKRLAKRLHKLNNALMKLTS